MTEPVAYMTKEGYVYGKHETRPIEADIPLYEYPPIAFAELEEGQSIPLYEHPEIVEDRESAIYATGYWNGIAYKKMRELSDEEIDNIFGISALNTTVTLTTKQCYWIVDAILKKVSEK